MAEPRPRKVTLREATSVDAPAIVRLVSILARAVNVVSPVNEGYVHEFLASPGSGILVADDAGQVIGLLSYSIRPSLVHAGKSCVIEELVVDQSARRQRVGAQLTEELLRRAPEWGCVEVSVTTLQHQRAAIEFYRAHGFIDDAVYLEKHLGGAEASDSQPLRPRDEPSGE